MNRVWITWETHRRTVELASAIPGLRLYELTLDHAPRAVRYPYLLFKTVRTLLKERPALAIVQNPSVVLSLFITAIGRIVGLKVVVDSHNEGIAPFYSVHNWLLPFYALIQKWADLTIVTNVGLAEIAERNGGVPFVLEDMLPRIEGTDTLDLLGTYNVVYVCTFEKDEPYMEFIKAAELISPATCTYITGRHTKISPDIRRQAPANVVFTGFLPDQEFINLLYSCDLVIDLTYMKDCLVCGAYEAVVLGKPIVLSDTKALRNYFSKGAVYTKNDSKHIAAAIEFALREKDKLAQEIVDLRQELQAEWNIKISTLLALLDRFTDTNTTI